MKLTFWEKRGCVARRLHLFLNFIELDISYLMFKMYTVLRRSTYHISVFFQHHLCFGTFTFEICSALRDLVPFVQFKKRQKHPYRTVNFSKIAGFSTKFQYQIAQRITLLGTFETLQPISYHSKKLKALILILSQTGSIFLSPLC